MNNISKIKNENCMGCFACSNICSKNAIKMDISSEGFYKPKIDELKCNNCGKCLKVCPVINNSETNREKGEVKVYGGWSTNNEIKLKSSSGGIFYEIANTFLNKGFKIVGAKFDDNLKLITKIAKNQKELKSILGSKYIPSSVGRTFNEIISLLENDDKVLFCGTPCQVEGLKLLLKEKKLKRNNNLFFISFICHGVGSLEIFNEYISKFKNIKSISFRDKTFGWKNFSMKIKCEDGEIIESKKENIYLRGYLKNLYLQKSCYKCKFANIPRVADITLGDYWNPPEKFDNFMGASVILSNNDYGDSIIKLLNKNKLYFEKISIDSVLEGNPRVSETVFNKTEDRDRFFQLFEEKGYREIKNKFFKKRNILYRILRKIKNG